MMPLARAAEENALRVDPALPEAHALLAVCAGGFGHDWIGAEREWRLAMEREPISRDVRLWYGNHYLLPIGRLAEAVETIASGLQEDPLNLIYRHHYARGLRHLGRLDEAEAELRASWTSTPVSRGHWRRSGPCARSRETRRGSASYPCSMSSTTSWCRMRARSGPASRHSASGSPIRRPGPPLRIWE